MDPRMLVDAKDCDDSCEVADGQTIKVSKVRSVTMLRCGKASNGKSQLAQVQHSTPRRNNRPLDYIDVPRRSNPMQGKRICSRITG